MLLIDHVPRFIELEQWILSTVGPRNSSKSQNNVVPKWHSFEGKFLDATMILGEFLEEHQFWGTSSPRWVQFHFNKIKFILSIPIG